MSVTSLNCTLCVFLHYFLFIVLSPQLGGMGSPQLGGAAPQGGMGGEIFGAPATSAPTTTVFGGLDFLSGPQMTSFYMAPKEVSSIGSYPLTVLVS